MALKDGGKNFLIKRRLFWMSVKALPKWFGFKQIYELKDKHLKADTLLRLMCKSAKEIRDPVNDKSWRDMIYEALLEAVENGNKEFFIEIIKYNPQLLWIFEAVSGRNLFQLAVVFRKEKIFNLIHGLDNRKVALLRSLDKDNNNILHIVAYLSPRPDHLSKISGSALKMQREIRWYMEVKSLVSEREVVQKNNEKMTPRQVFEVSHEPLRKEGEEWMKYTATACSFVAALIATVTFQAIFTVPGGYDETLGKPLLLRDLHFTAFIISDSLAFFTSCTSVLIFLSILTARYSFDDFIVSLPRKMIFGLAILFFSIASLLVGFITALSSTMRQKPTLVVPMKPLAALPVLLFLMLQYPLLKEMISSTYGKRLFHRDTKSWLELPGQDQHANVTSVYVGSSHSQHSVNSHRSQ
ncbi:BnaA03g01370D [Brassica napus]|uniref:BnaA03g01370D protein n=1 Tax=Brassica napus TaxID=3708 RepID=A0A078FDA0_BRANA|nr:BnaA03g01370D [Brassica napus]